MKTSRVGIGIIFLLLGTLGPGPRSWAEDEVPGETLPERQWEQRRYVVEWFGGLAGSAASDLKTLVAYDQQVQQHLFDSQLDSLQSSGQIASWRSEQSGERPTIETSWSMGVRVKRRQNATLALSVGLQYLTAGGSSDVRSGYTRDEHNGDRRIEELSYLPYTLSARAWAPLVGIHLGRSLGSRLALEGFLLGGPLFADFEYQSDWSYAFSIRGPSMNGIVFETDGGLDGGGQGTGVSVELGCRLRLGLSERFAVFVEGGYARQRVTSPSGPGSQVRGGERVEWEGEWGIREDTITAPWGNLELQRPTNDWPEGSADGRLGDFSLDFSGFRLTLGVSFDL